MLRSFLSGLVLLLTASFLLPSCNSKEDAAEKQVHTEQADSAALYYYQLRAKGQFADYVAAMESCDSTTEAYRKQMERLLRHHQQKVVEEKQGLASVRVERTEMYDSNRVANVFLTVTYKDGTHEEILFPVVYDGHHWRVR